ncbi:28S ribosomal protein S29, mitochondrial [Lingula anatina]|uniref:Small ribosomal subunit protein mS29 n=1 Tax=Lingula anatina TaxID=7574 RepID=A0A1S3HWK7_LINAN|nr:28S ribosomal protein S29, mitochondrial [Lingula anatina]|eukprot:XP_013389936.1 28S ribosomal protein S29, mitochondrial [Lingula anatina]
MAASMLKNMIVGQNNIFRVIGYSFPHKKVCLNHYRCCTSIVHGNDNVRTEQDVKPRRPRVCRTTVSSPAHQTKDQIGQFYTVPEPIAKKVFTRGWLNPKLLQLFDTFNETSIMVRKPALEIIDLMKSANYKDPVIKYVIYGPQGTGKSTTLAHVAHYALEEDFMIIHVPWPKHIYQFPATYQESTYKEDRHDTLVESLKWMNSFRKLNQHHLEKLKTTKKCVWTKKDSSLEGTPITDLIEMGLDREKHIPDIVGMIIREVKKQAADLGLKVLVVVDGVNSLFQETTVKVAPGEFRPSSQIGLVQHFMKLLQNDWAGGAVLLTVDRNASKDDKRESDLPKYLLGKEGFAVLDPFIPFQTELYSEEEFHSCIEYFKERRWLQGEKGQTQRGIQQIRFLSGRNPYFVERACSAW